MGWTERQTGMLAEMGIALWPQARPLPVEADGGAAAGPQADAGGPAPAPVSVPAPVPAPVPPPRPAPPAAARVLPPLVAASAAAMPSTTGAATGAATPSAVATMDWPALEAAVAGCRACALCESRRHTVFGVGHRQARWMLVGEAPGEQEDLQGEPFVGKAGQLLDNMLRAVGLTREAAEAERQVYIANVLKCRPPHNRNPEPQEVARCAPYLQRQVELVAPQLILAMGRFAVQSILQTGEPIGRLRGRVHQYHGVPVVVTYHPAYLLRNPLDKSRAWEDLCLAREVLAGQGAG